ncbi:MAG: aryl-sulfate sulfotransferase [Alphaproteobacteria bacterium]|nr:aryl-sulfate sulfotransferase [Alphaproteobacteria bacterium]
MLLLLALACAQPDSGAPLPDDTGFFDDDSFVDLPDGDLQDVTGVISGVVPTVVRVQWTSPVAGRSHVEHGLTTALGQATPDDAGGTTHDVLVLGLRAGAEHHLQAVTVADDGTELRSDVGAVTLSAPPRAIGRFTLTVDDDAARPDGYVLTSLLQAADSWVVILDRDGEVVWYYPATDGFSIPTTKPGRDGRSILLTQNGQDQVEDVSNIQRVAVDGSGHTETRALLGHHSFVERADGAFAWLSLDIRDVEVDGVLETVAGDSILFAAEGATDADPPGELFTYFDDWGDPYRMCEHFDAEAYGTGALDWTHGNSLMQVDGDDDLYLMSKNHDHVLRVDGQTGAVVWQLGGPESDFEIDPAAMWSHAHMSHLWDGGMVVFDNGYHHDRVFSRVVAYQWDEVGGRVRQTFRYDDPQRRFIQLLGDGRLLDNGNVLASWTSAGIVNELTPDGQVAWQVESDLGTAVGRVTLIDDLYTLSRGEAH